MCLALLVGSSGCLITSDPDFRDPERTRPLLIASDATPPFAFYELPASGGDPQTPTYKPKVFRALLLSEDLDEHVEGVLLTDYGVPNAITNRPYAHDEAIPNQNPATLSAGARELSVEWNPSPASLVAGTGCHSVTLLVTHEFTRGNDGARFFCPDDPNDFSTLSWFVVLCELDAQCNADACPKAASVTEVCGTGAETGVP